MNIDWTAAAAIIAAIAIIGTLLGVIIRVSNVIVLNTAAINTIIQGDKEQWVRIDEHTTQLSNIDGRMGKAETRLDFHEKIIMKKEGA